MDQYLGSIFLFGGNFTIRGCAPCAGALLSISTNTALFSLLGTLYGGDGQTTFALPDLRGRTPIGYGQGPGLSSRTQGELSGTENTTLLVSNMPAHTHALTANNQGSNEGTPGPTVVLSQGPGGGGPKPEPAAIYSINGANTTLAPYAIGLTGGNQPLSIMQPYLVLNYLITLVGVFPSRN